jgi:hypothetical protein
MAPLDQPNCLVVPQILSVRPQHKIAMQRPNLTAIKGDLRLSIPDLTQLKKRLTQAQSASHRAGPKRKPEFVLLRATAPAPRRSTTISRAAWRRCALCSSSLPVEATSNRSVIHGSAPSYYLKQLAVREVCNLPQVSRMLNDPIFNLFFERPLADCHEPLLVFERSPTKTIPRVLRK